MVLKSSYTKGSKIRLCTRGGVTILQCGTPIPIDEDDLKYGDRDITSGSIVFRCSKDNEAGDEPLPESIYEPKLLSSYDENQLNIKEKVFISCK